MKIKDIYGLVPTSINQNVFLLEKVFDEISQGADTTALKVHSLLKKFNSIYELQSLLDENLKNFEIREYLSEGDDKYGGSLYGLFFENKPVMIFTKFGRYYSEISYFITNLNQFNLFLDYLLSHNLELSSLYQTNTFDEDYNIDEVYGYSLEEFYNFKEVKFKENDVVWAIVPENNLYHPNSHCYYDTNSTDYKGYIITRVKITKINPTKSFGTYLAKAIDINHSFANKTRYFSKDNGNYFHLINDSNILGLCENIEIPALSIDNLVDSCGILPPNYRKEFEDLF